MSNLSLSDSFSIGKSHKFNTKNFPIILLKFLKSIEMDVVHVHWTKWKGKFISKMEIKSVGCENWLYFSSILFTVSTFAIVKIKYQSSTSLWLVR